MEVLVHISGPSRVKDDKKYRKQAEGLQAFDGVRVEHVHTSNKRARAPEESNAEASTAKRQRRSFNPAKGLAASAFTSKTTPNAREQDSQQTHESSQETRDSTPSVDKGFQKHVAEPSDDACPTSSLDSNTYCQLARARALNHVRTTSAPVNASPRSGAIQVRRSASDSFETPPSVVPDSQPSQGSLKRAFCIEESQIGESADSPETKRQRRAPTPERASPAATTCQDEIHSSVGGLRDEQSPSPEVTLRDVNKSCTNVRGLFEELRSKFHANAQTKGNAQTTQRFSDEQSNESSVRVVYPLGQLAGTPQNWQIHHTFSPTIPGASGEVFTTHLTPLLKWAATAVNMTKRYKPHSQLRPVEPLERGRWEFVLPAQTSDPKKRQELLRDLNHFFGQGRSGWGTWCQVLAPTFDPDETIGESTAERRQGREERLEQDWLIRIWCWGEVVGHIYLLLYLTTKREVKGLGAVWVDAEGNAVVQME